MKVFKFAHTTAALLALSAGLVQAAEVTQWSLGVDSRFDPLSIVDSNGGTPGGVTISNSDRTLRWGSSGESGLDITNSPVNTTVNTNGAAVANIAVTHVNNPIQPPTLDRVNILSTLTLTPLLPPMLPGLPSVTQTFGINFQETTNNASPCADGGANGVGVNINGCGDIFVLESNILNFSFFYDTDGVGGDPTQEYFISFFEQTGGLNPLSAAACLAATGSNAPCLGFVTPEGATTTFNFAAVITTERVQIPEPGSLALAGVALAGLAGLARRRKTHA